MTKELLVPNWKDVVVFSAAGPQPYVVTDTPTHKAIIAGLAAGVAIPPHPEGAAIFHFLEGTGQMVVGEETLAVQAGATVVVTDGAVRGIEAKTQLAFLVVRVPR
jgi:mannose-6-phosphate isomerase-like protein (cupin superfamily)